MLARDVMTADVVVVQEDTPLAEAERLMVEHEVSGLPVVDGDGVLVGIMTERDVLLRHEAIQHVRDVMTRNLVTAPETADYYDMIEILLQHRIKRVPIVTEEHRLVGIVSRTDLIRGRLAEESAASARQAGDKK